MASSLFTLPHPNDALRDQRNRSVTRSDDVARGSEETEVEAFVRQSAQAVFDQAPGIDANRRIQLDAAIDGLCQNLQRELISNLTQLQQILALDASFWHRLAPNVPLAVFAEMIASDKTDITQPNERSPTSLPNCTKNSSYPDERALDESPSTIGFFLGLRILSQISSIF